MPFLCSIFRYIYLPVHRLKRIREKKTNMMGWLLRKRTNKRYIWLPAHPKCPIKKINLFAIVTVCRNFIEYLIESHSMMNFRYYTLYIHVCVMVMRPFWASKKDQRAQPKTPSHKLSHFQTISLLLVIKYNHILYYIPKKRREKRNELQMHANLRQRQRRRRRWRRR